MASVNYYLDQIFKTPDNHKEKEKITKTRKQCKKERKAYPLSILNTRSTAVYLVLTPDHFGGLMKCKTKYKIIPKNWDFKSGRVKSSYTGGVEINIELGKFKTQVEELYNKGSFTSAVNLKDKIKEIVLGKSKTKVLESSNQFFDVFNEFLTIQSDIKEPSTIKKYITTYKNLMDFEVTKGYKITFESIDLNFYDKYRSYLTNKSNPRYKDKVLVKSDERNCYLIADKGTEGGIKIGLFNDTVSRYISDLKYFMKWTQKRSKHNNSDYKDFETIRKAKNEIVTLTAAELNGFYNFDFSNNKRLERVRDLFCFGCFTGQRWSDIENFRKEDLKNDVWAFTSYKTKKPTRVPLAGFSKPALDILKKYKYMLPVISGQKFNDYIKEATKVAQITSEVVIKRFSGNKEIDIIKPKYEFISSHAARRSCVTILLERGIPATTVMKLTGHSDIRTLMKYESTSDEALIKELERVGELGEIKMKVAK